MTRVLFVLVIFIVAGCKATVKEKDEVIDDNSLIKRKYANDVIVYEQVFSKDSLGELLPNGYRKEYYEDGKLKTFYKYRFGHQDSTGLEYFPDGTLSAEYYRFGGGPLGRQVEYYSNGTIRNLVLSCFADTGLFQMHYKENGELYNVDGIPLYLKVNKDSVKLREIFVINNQVLVVRGYSTKLIIKIFDPSGHEVNHEEITQFENYKNVDYYNFQTQFENTGTCIYEATVEFTDSSGKVIKRGTERRKITIVP